MGPITYSMCFFVLLLHIASGQVMTDMINNIAEGQDVERCNNRKTENITCSTQDGDLISIKTGDPIPPHTMCYETDKENGFLCLTNGIKLEESFAPRKATRHKRFIGLIIYGIVCLFVCKDERPKPRKPPTLHCAALIGPTPVYAKRGEETAVVSWTDATATDDDGKGISVDTRPKSYKSGNPLSQGHYALAFHAEDSKSLSASCGLVFEVKVHRCGMSPWPENGILTCDGYFFGKACTVQCLTGYQLKPGDAAKITCEKNGQWSRKTPSCMPKACKPVPSVPNGEIKCPNDEFVYGSSCLTTCEDGYKLIGTYFVSCDENGDWSRIGICKDVVPPVFNMKTCPDNIVVNIDSANNTALVQWTVPEGTDNSGQQPIITEINGYTPNSRFAAGIHLLNYKIEDSEGNVGQSCAFMLRVQTINCEPPNLDVEGGSHMVYTCPESYRFGADCMLSCKAGYPLGGVDKISCLNIDESTTPPVLDWRWPEDALGPYCKETVCPDLRAPINGATSCDLWTYGRQCQIQCQKGFDFAHQFPEIYVCGTNTGQWKPTDTVADCTRKLSPNQAQMMSDVYYYTGECNSSEANLLEIKNNFIDALNSSNYNAVCIGERFCRADFVNVTCGPTQSRRRRDTNQHNILTRSAYTFAYVVQFELLVPLNDSDTQSDFPVKAMLLQEMVNEIQTEMDSGHFDINPGDMHIEDDSFGPGIPSYKCPKGTKARLTTGSCAGCPVGMLMSEEDGSCRQCPFGTYQDNINSVTCKTCPIETSTDSAGSANATQCKAMCDAGSYSSTGLVPCMKCPTTHYQSSKGQTTCMPCNSLKRTLDVGATMATECRAYDVLMSHGKGVAIDNRTSTSSSATMLSWILVHQIQGTNALLRLESASNYILLTFKESGDIVFDLNGTLLNTNVSMEKNQWVHLAMVLEYSSQTIELYRNGRLVFREMSQFLPSNNILENSGNVVINADVQLSSFHLLNTTLTEEHIQQFAKSCVKSVDGSFINLDDIELRTDARLIMPSQCDDVNECSSKPCGSHECVNKLGEFECVCTDGYTGLLCTIPPDFCKSDSCLNGGTCKTGASNYTCLCQHGFRGARCDIKARNGEWSEWSDWSLCSQTCAGGVTTRNRRCDNPPPDQDGEPCKGTDTESKPCNTEKCPECLKLRRTYGLLIQCNDTESSQKCTLSCRKGLYFASHPLQLYECGRATGYKWNHQSSENPDGRLPTCSNVKPAEKVSVDFDGEYDIDPCDKSTVFSLNSALETKLQNTTCLRSASCKHMLSTTQCQPWERKRRSLPGQLRLSITLSLDIQDRDWGSALENLLENKTADTELLEVLGSMIDLERTAQEIYNDSIDFLQVEVGEKSLSPVQPMGLPVTSVVCPHGSVRLDLFCAVVPQGSYIQGTSVILCPKGQYQDLEGQTECKICPAMTSTSGIGSTSLEDCISEDSDKESENLSSLIQLPVSAGQKTDSSKDVSFIGYPPVHPDILNRNDPGKDAVIPLAVGLSVTAVAILCIVTLVVIYRHVHKRNSVNDSTINLHSKPPVYIAPPPYTVDTKLYKA